MSRMKRLPKISRVSRYRDMAVMLQDAMRRKGITTIAALTEAVGLETHQAAGVYNWLAGKNGPSSLVRPKLLKALDLDEAAFAATLPEKVLSRRQSKNEPVLGPAQRAVALVNAKASNGELLPKAPPVTDVFSFRARSDGDVVVRLEATLPFARGAQLMQFLLGFGLVIGSEDRDEHTGRERGGDTA